ncbi:MAG: uroporphyrinogen-III C-methyltransferase [Pseudomonadota bacterium]
MSAYLPVDTQRNRSESDARIGRVTLVGAGPGDPDLLTLKAVRVLQDADVILFDDLVSEGVLDLARREAKRMLVGKRGYRPSCKQDDINAMMVRLAKAGRHVVRLKSGDPMIFGRAGEEIKELREAGIPVDVVPGITASCALAAAATVSLTHRDHAQAVTYVTGHARNGKLPETLDVRALAAERTTLIVYMGGRTSGLLAQKMIDEGADAARPCIIARSLSRPDEEVWHGTLGELASASAFEIVAGEGPILVGIGDVFSEARSLQSAMLNAPSMVATG